ncbi:MAG: hypothetical protein J5632_04330 [Bacteroidales bacterium]|nr:hypothetical protein [Bacteroidales bacterium]
MKVNRILAIAAVAAAIVACGKNSAKQMAEAASQVSATSEPAALTLVGDTIPVTVTVNYPKDYFRPDAIVTVTPVIVYNGGEQAGKTYTYQGSEVKDNYPVVSTDGGTVTEHMVFNFVPGMEVCYLELRSACIVKKKTVDLPTMKVCEGVVMTGKFAQGKGYYEYREDGYPATIEGSKEGQIKYDINSANVKAKELKGASITEYQAALKEAVANERVTIKGIEIVSYASPDGGEELNAKLSDKRSGAAEKAWGKITKGIDSLAAPSAKSVGQDWEGFQEAVSKSDIADKDLIVRVLSMYSDPEVREKEIKNMSAVYNELRKEVLPELRRTRFIATTEFRNYSNEELEALSGEDVANLDETALLRLGAISKEPAKKQEYYQAAVNRFNSEPGKYNLALASFDADENAQASTVLGQLADQNADDVLNAKAVAAIRAGKYDEAKALLDKCDQGNKAVQHNYGVLALVKGDFATAADKLNGAGGVDEAVAAILAGKYSQAEGALDGDESANAEYLRAVIAARQQKVLDAAKYLVSACKKDPSLKEKALKDVELANVAK